MKLSEKQLIILEALARFKYLTSQQLQQIFGKKSCSYINSAIRKLRLFKPTLIRSIDFGVIAGVGRLAKVHCLTPAGAKLLVNDLGYRVDQVQYPRNRNSFFNRDYFHRIATINFSIQFQQWLARNRYTLNFIKLYFNRSRHVNRDRSSTALFVENKWIEPDLIGKFHAKGQTYIFIFEQHNGKDAQRAIRQIKMHCYCLAIGILSDYYGVKRAVSIYYAFEHEPCMKAVIDIFNKNSDLMKFKDYFYFKTNIEVETNFQKSWYQADHRTIEFNEVRAKSKQTYQSS